MLIEINNLKLVNDKYGHAEGDSFIQAICRVIEAEIDEDDVLFRYGGDEFIILFPTKKATDVESILTNITNGFTRKNEAITKSYQLSASHGLFHYQHGMDVTLEDILEYADHEMYQEKILAKREKILTFSKRYFFGGQAPRRVSSFLLSREKNNIIFR